jgi:hypothetical protein
VCPGLTGWLRACGAARVAWLGWRGDGFEEDESGSALVPAVGGSARGELPLVGPVTATLAAGAWLPLRRITVRYQLSPAVADDPSGGSEVLYRAARASVWAGVGVAVRFY